MPLCDESVCTPGGVPGQTAGMTVAMRQFGQNSAILAGLTT